MQERVKSRCGITFPGGHVENGESFYESAVREVWEETGLKIRNLKSCGVIHWNNSKTGDRYTAKIDDIPNMKLSVRFSDYLLLFSEDKNEFFALWNEQDENEKICLY